MREYFGSGSEVRGVVALCWAACSLAIRVSIYLSIHFLIGVITCCYIFKPNAVELNKKSLAYIFKSAIAIRIQRYIMNAKA